MAIPPEERLVDESPSDPSEFQLDPLLELSVFASVSDPRSAAVAWVRWVIAETSVYVSVAESVVVLVSARALPTPFITSVTPFVTVVVAVSAASPANAGDR